MTEDRLARRYWDLLDFYPRWYREQRGEELVGTLLECARPGQARPTWREARALVVEGLRLRVRGSAADGLRLVVLLALATWVLTGVTGQTGRPGLGPVLAALGAVPFGLVAWGRPGWAVPFPAAGVVVLVAVRPGEHLLTSYDAYLLVPVVVALAGTVLLWRRPALGRTRAGAGMLGYAVVPPLIVVLPTWLAAAGVSNPGDLFWYYQTLLFAVLYLAALAVAAIDPRPALVMAAFIVLYVLQVMATLVAMRYPVDELAWFGVPVGLLLAAGVAGVAAWLGIRRQVAAGRVGLAG